MSEDGYKNLARTRDAERRRRLAARSRRRVRRLSRRSKYPPLPTAGGRLEPRRRLKQWIFPALAVAVLLVVGVAGYLATRTPQADLPTPTTPDTLLFPGHIKTPIR